VVAKNAQADPKDSMQLAGIGFGLSAQVWIVLATGE